MNTASASLSAFLGIVVFVVVFNFPFKRPPTMTFSAQSSFESIASPDSDNNQVKASESVSSEPQWLLEGKLRDSWGEHFSRPEWEDETDQKGYRAKNGWKGRDYIHDRAAPVRVLDYYVAYGTGGGVEGLEKGGVGTIITGVVHFTERAESHQGLCHGGSMCSVMDDIIGWCAMFVTGACHPWSGYTVQVNTALRRPIPVGTFLLAKATIVSVERRKVSIKAVILDPDMDSLHAEGEGLVVMNKGVLP